MLNNALIAAPTPSNEKINKSQGDVPNKPSKNLPKKTPTKTDDAIVTPICEKYDSARIVSLFLDCRLPNIASSLIKNMVP